jgi:phosphate acetyltransferase
MLQPNYYGAMMLAMHQADGLVSGASHITGSVLRPLFQIIKACAGHSNRIVLHGHGSRRLAHRRKRRAVHGRLRRHSRSRRWTSLPTSPCPPPGSRGTCSACAARGVALIFHQRQRVASQRRQSPGRDRHGQTQSGTTFHMEADFDGELQVDAALVPEIAERKMHESPGGRARERADFSRPQLRQYRQQTRLLVGRANAYGQILLGLNRPAADVSRGSTAHDILGVAAIIGVQATDYQKLYPGARRAFASPNGYE